MVRAKIAHDLTLMSLTEAVAAERQMRPAEAQEVIQTTLDVIGRALAGGHSVKLTNFATFTPGKRSLGAGSLGGRVERRTTVKVVRFHLNGKLHDAIRAGRKVTSLKKDGKSPKA
jgi:nucleoid DNA-binding protein